MSLFDENYIKKLQDDARALITDKVVQALAEKKKSHKAGVLCRYTVNSAISCLAANNIQVNRKFLCKKVARELENQRNTKSVSDQPKPKKAPPKTPANLVVSVAGSPCTASTLTDDTSVEETSGPSGGRPKGSTAESKRKSAENYKTCLSTITLEFSKKLADSKLGKA